MTLIMAARFRGCHKQLSILGSSILKAQRFECFTLVSRNQNHSTEIEISDLRLFLLATKEGSGGESSFTLNTPPEILNKLAEKK